MDEKKNYIIAFFTVEKDLQQALNSIVQAGFDTADVSMIMKDKEKESDEVKPPYDENDPMNEAEGTMWAVDAEEVDTAPISIPGVGEVVVSGPLLDVLDKTEGDVDSTDEIQGKYDQLIDDLTELGL